MDEYLIHAINKVSPKLVDGGRKLRGPNSTFDFLYSVWIEKAIIQTLDLQNILNRERQEYLKQQKMVNDIGTQGKYTRTFGWSRRREFKFNFSISPATYQYFANIVGPFMDTGKEFWSDINSKMWNKIRRMIISGDRIGISKLQKHIITCLLREQSKRIKGVENLNGNEDKSVSEKKCEPKDDIQQQICDGDLREGSHPLQEPKNNSVSDGLGEDVRGGEGCLGEVEEAGGTFDGEHSLGTLSQTSSHVCPLRRHNDQSEQKPIHGESGKDIQ